MKIRSAMFTTLLLAVPSVLVSTSIVPASGATTTSTINTLASSRAFKDLEQRATRNGRVPVIVEYDTGSAGVNTASTFSTTALVHKRDTVIARFGHKHLVGLKALPGAPFMALHANRAELDTLAHTPGIKSVTLDGVHELAGTSPNGDAAGVQSPMKNWWDYYRVGEDWTRTNGYTGKGQQVVIIDTGVDRTHPWLQGRVVNEACFATNPNGTGACNNGQTYQYNTTAAGVTGAASPCTWNDYSCSHGTHVAQTAAGLYGVAPGASIVAIKAAHMEWSTKSNQWLPMFNDSDLQSALWYVYSPLPTIPAAINMSIGGNRYYGSCDNASTSLAGIASYINALKSQYGIATVVASGNDNYSDSMGSPACITNAISVGNTTLDAAGNDAVFGNTTYGSNSNATLDLLAPGTDICSAIPVAFDHYDGTKDGMACDWGGTSMAAPHVAGAFAVMRQSRPSATVDTIVSALQRRGTAVTDSRNNITRTRINVAMSVYYW